MSEPLPDEAEARIAAGPFLMGRSGRDLFADPAEQPLRIVTLCEPFAIDVHPVSNRRFRRFLDDGGYREPRFWSQEGWRWLQQIGVDAPRSFDHLQLAADDQPVCGVSWHEAQAFCAWADRRLPTSAEWERAARGLDARPFPWGWELPYSKRCNFDDAVGRTTPLGSYPDGVSPCGLHDMAGNVNNWVEDVYWPGFGTWCAREGRLTDPVLTPELARSLGVDASKRTDRGGGYRTSDLRFEVLGTTLPLGWSPGSREPWHGFRTARTL